MSSPFSNCSLAFGGCKNATVLLYFLLILFTLSHSDAVRMSGVKTGATVLPKEHTSLFDYVTMTTFV
jgi:hypothetical protein